ncbi:hypothetical protein KY339_01450 [Candidatus Woesearchaeota archaeon]|nr:hypothetical protein [Candidatus Woesearchaeota archaeon]
MQFINYFLTSIICFLGPFCGLALARIAPEELGPGQKYFRLFEKIIFMLIIIVFVYFIGYQTNPILSIIFVLLSIYYLKFVHGNYVYYFLAFIFFLSSRETQFFIVESVLIFLFGFARGTLLSGPLFRKKILVVIKELLIKNISFLIIALLLRLLPFYFSYA